MCFSAQASFTASALLFLIGFLNYRTNRTAGLKVFALMPILFAIQQFSEGMLWVSFNFPGLQPLQTVSKYFFLAFAIVIWPVFVSYSLLKVERKEIRRNALKLFLAFSVVWSISAMVYMALYNPTAAAAKGHIMYNVFMPYQMPFDISLIYGVLTVLPFFVSEEKMFWVFGSLVTITGTLTYIVYSSFFTSIWCFFAALVSTHTHAIVRKENLENPWKLDWDLDLPDIGG